MAAGAGFFQRVVQVGTTLVIMPAVLRTLGASKFGVWGAVTSLAWLRGLVDLGVGAALVTLIARAAALNRSETVRNLILGALGLGASLALVLSLIGSAVVVATVPQPRAGLFLIAVIAMALNIPLDSSKSVWMGFQKGHISGGWDLVQTLLTGAALIVATIYTSEVRIYILLVYAALLVSNLSCLVHLLLARRELHGSGLTGIGEATRGLFRQGMSYFLLSVASALSYLLDNVLALQLLGPEASAQMAIALRICMLSWGFLEVLSLPLWPAFAEAGVNADLPWIRRNLTRGTGLMISVALGGGALLLLLGKPVLRLWLRTDLGINQGLLIAIAAWILAQALNRVPNVFLNAVSVVRFQAMVGSIATVVAYLLKFFLASRVGVGGILWGTTSSILLIVLPANLWRIRKWHKTTRPKTPEEQPGLENPVVPIPSTDWS